MPNPTHVFDIAATDNPVVAEVYEHLRWLEMRAEYRPDETPRETAHRFERLFLQSLRSRTLIACALDNLAPSAAMDTATAHIRNDLDQTTDRLSTLFCLSEGTFEVVDGEARLREARILLEKTTVMICALEQMTPSPRSSQVSRPPSSETGRLMGDGEACRASSPMAKNAGRRRHKSL
ncbi:hypothetical protein [Telmatospirillum siberiense]|uniref:Uncharacterized protein n=1 Tax=Telmatospirillum siberiense TaxID=382514 RepID=A0A2N3PNI9_9PROT|nr:hypothetical protein [Telmatospirillum siberiense]PKU21968.1 hypothetical protein CWS72_23990 [Telmatospirillum siberiense]